MRFQASEGQKFIIFRHLRTFPPNARLRSARAQGPRGPDTIDLMPDVAIATGIPRLGHHVYHDWEWFQPIKMVGIKMVMTGGWFVIVVN